MKKQYFSKDAKNGLKAMYAVAFTNDEEMSLFTKLIADEYGYEKYCHMPELFVDDDKYTLAIAYDIVDGNDRKKFEQAYNDVKKALKKNEPKLITLSTVISMGWTKAMIEALLPEPKLVENPHYRKAAPMKLFRERDVLEAMKSEEYKQALEKANRRKMSAKKATETKKKLLAENMKAFADSITVIVIDDDKLIDKTIAAKNRWYDLNEKYYEEIYESSVDPDTLQRWIVNYIRHNLVHYDDGLYLMKGKVGGDEVYFSYKKAIMEKIAAAYPKYAEECARQIQELE